MTSTIPQELWDQDLTAAEPTGPDWLWHGLLARGPVTLLTGLWKTGKITLRSLLLSRSPGFPSFNIIAGSPGSVV